jgi:hypothetical protein
MTRNEFKEKYPNLETGDIIICNYEQEDRHQIPILICCDKETHKMKLCYLTSHGMTSMNIICFSETIIN